MASDVLAIECIPMKNIPTTEMKMLEEWSNTGVKIFLDAFQTKKTEQIRGENPKQAKTSVATDMSKNALGLGLGTATTAFLGPSCGKMVAGLGKGIIGSVSERLCNTIVNRMNEKKRNNILTWTNTLTKEEEKEFVRNVAHGMALICISYKEQIKTFLANDFNKINFFNDVVRRILNYLSENPSTGGRKLTDEILFHAFSFGRSIYKTVKWIRGLKIASHDGKKWNSREIFEESGLILQDGRKCIQLCIFCKKDTVKEYSCKDFRFVHPFEDINALLSNYRKLEVGSLYLRDLLADDWRLHPGARETFINRLAIQFPKDLEERKPTQHDKEIKTILLNLQENMQVALPEVKENVLPDKWWPEKQMLVNSFYKRKNMNGFLILTIMKKLEKDEHKMVVITHKDKVPGLGGIGKTSMAKWFAIYFEKHYDFIIWMDCGEGSLLKSFKGLARDLALDNRTELDLSSLARKCYEKLGDRKCLFIYDNAERYQGTEGIKDILSYGRNNFHCLITSRCQEGWGSQTGYGEISQFHLGVFFIEESLQFLDKNIKPELTRSNYHLEQLSELLGNLPLALQLAVAALNTEKIKLCDYIAKASAEDAGKIVDETFDDYAKTINKNVQISLELIKEETCGKIAYDILMTFGYIRPENVEQAFLKTVLNTNDESLEAALQLLVKYSLITKGGKIKQYINTSFLDKILFVRRKEVEVDTLSIHRLVQQVIRHNEVKSQNDTLEKILGCVGFLDYKIVPYTYADSKIRKKFPSIRKQLIRTESLIKLLTEGRCKEAIELSNLINSDFEKPTTLYNYAVCLEKHGNLVEALKELKKLESSFEDETQAYGFYGLGIHPLSREINKSIVYTKILNVQQLQLNVLLQEKNYSEALQLSQSIHIELKSLSSLYNNALCLEKSGNIEGALKNFENLFANANISANSCFPNPTLVKEINSCFRGIRYDLHNYEDWKQLIEINGWSENFMTEKESFTKLTSLLQLWNYSCNDKKQFNLDDPIDLWEVPHKFLIVAQLIRILCKSGKSKKAEKIVNQLLKTWKNCFAQENNCAIYFTELLRLMKSFDYNFSYCCDGDQCPKIYLEGIEEQSVTLKLWNFPESFYIPEHLQELTLDSLTILNSKGKKLSTFDINHLLGPNLKKLALISENDSTKFLIALDLLKSIELLNLVGCTIILPLVGNERRISPKEMQFNDVSFIQEDYVLVNELVNDYVALDNLTKLSLQDSTIQIDLSDSSMERESLYLDKVNVQSWEDAQWNVKTMVLVDMPFVTKNQMKIQNLTILNESVGINLQCIPQNVEYLSLSSSLTMNQPPEVNFPKLTHLELHNDCVLNLPCFANCPNIKNLVIELQETFCVEMASIPKSVRNIWFKGHMVEIIGNDIHSLENLILEKCTLTDVESMLARFKSDTIVLKTKDYIKSSDLTFCKQIIQKSNQSCIFIGPFQWKDIADFFTDHLSKSVDKMAEFYVFENGNGKGISELDVQNIIESIMEL